MSRLVVVIMEGNSYPFGQCDNSQLQKKKVMVRKIVEFHPLQKVFTLSKVKKLKNLSNPYIIKLEQLLEQDMTLHLLYEYVPIKIETWISNLNQEFIEKFHTQLLQLGSYLIENNICIDFKLKNVGMDQNYNPKYFIGLDYETNNQISSAALFNKYQNQINQMLYPLFANKKPNLNSNEQILSRTFIKQIQSQKLKVPLKKPNQQLIKFSTPKRISVHDKIENIGKKICDLKKIMNTIQNNQQGKKDKSLFLSQTKDNVQSRPNSSQKFIHKNRNSLYRQNSGNLLKKEKDDYLESQLRKPKQLRQTQSESEFQFKYTSNDLCNENEAINTHQQKQIINKSQTFLGQQKKGYIYQFQNILNDDDQEEDFNLDGFNPKIENKVNPLNNEIISNNTLKMENMKTQSQRNSFSYSNKRRKRSGSSINEDKITSQRVAQVLSMSKKLINKFKRPYFDQNPSN